MSDAWYFASSSREHSLSVRFTMPAASASHLASFVAKRFMLSPVLPQSPRAPLALAPMPQLPKLVLDSELLPPSLSESNVNTTWPGGLLP
ncbi:MAG: hypothetical protein ACPIOQ_32795, partial [Promethearchaeia archaeon]